MTMCTLYNYQADRADHRPFPDTDEEAVLYIPQDHDSQNLYYAYRDSGKAIADAMAEVLTFSLYRPEQSWPRPMEYK